MMLPKNEIKERAESDGTMDRVNQLLSASHLLLCVSNNLIDEAGDLLSEKKLLLGEIKMQHNAFVKCADRYFHFFATMITEKKSEMDMFADMEAFEKAFRKWAKL